MSHTGLVAHEGGKVDRLLGVILRESLHFAAVAGAALSGQETERAVSLIDMKHD